MKATQILMAEHRIILSVIDVIESIAAKIEAGERVDHEHLEGIVDFIVNFADGCHHAKEEGLLFPAMIKAGFPEKQGPIAVMLAEHVEGRAYVRAMKAALARSATEGAGALHDFAENALGYVGLLRNHIHKEDNILFRMADERLEDAVQKELVAAFEKVEEEEIGPQVHEKYHEMAHDLVSTYLART